MVGGVGWGTLTLALSLRERGLRRVGGLVGLDWGGGRAGLSGADGFYYESFEGADLAGESFLVVFDGPEADVEFFHVGSHFFSEFVHFLSEAGEVGAHFIFEFVHLLSEAGEVAAHLIFEF